MQTRGGALLIAASLCCVTSVTDGAAVASPASPASPSRANDNFFDYQRLSLDLRTSPLTLKEREEIARTRASGVSDAAIYESYVRRWFRPTFFDSVFSETPEASAEAYFLGRMAIYKEGPTPDKWIYYLPTVQKAGSKDAPCEPSARIRVVPWWSGNTTVTVCRDSYRPETAFDTVGYCAGRTELVSYSPPRPGCACGPLLLACLPPEETHPLFRQRIDAALASELSETTGKILFEGRPYSDVVTTSTTWQNGINRFFYLRAELLRSIAEERYSPSLETRLVTQLRTANLEAPATWVERKGMYAGSGLVGTPKLIATYRRTTRLLLANLLCLDLKGVNVDSESVLSAVGKQHGDLQLLETDSPMRTQTGCKGCHAPMDNTAGFLYAVKPSIQGNRRTSGNVPLAKLYVHGADDYRGEGSGFADLTKLIVKQPEFDSCMVRKTLNALRVQVTDEERDAYVVRFKKEKGNVKKLVEAVLLSSAYRQGGSP